MDKTFEMLQHAFAWSEEAGRTLGRITCRTCRQEWAWPVHKALDGGTQLFLIDHAAAHEAVKEDQP